MIAYLLLSELWNLITGSPLRAHHMLPPVVMHMQVLQLVYLLETTRVKEVVTMHYQ